jgi:TonB family protein
MQARQLGESNPGSGTANSRTAPTNTHISELEGILDLLDLHLQSEKNLLNDLASHSVLLRTLATDLDPSASLETAKPLGTALDELFAAGIGREPSKSTSVSADELGVEVFRDKMNERPKQTATVQRALPMFEIASQGAGTQTAPSGLNPPVSSRRDGLARWGKSLWPSIATRGMLRWAGVVSALLIAAVASALVGPRLLRQFDLEATSTPASSQPSARPSPSGSPATKDRNAGSAKPATFRVAVAPPKSRPKDKNQSGVALTPNGDEGNKDVGLRKKAVEDLHQSSLTVHGGVERHASLMSANALVTPRTVPPRLLARVEPIYPVFARQSKIQGDVQLLIRIDASGFVEEVLALDGPAALIPAAADAVRQWRYRPQSVDGQPVDSENTVTLRFRLN